MKNQTINEALLKLTSAILLPATRHCSEIPNSALQLSYERISVIYSGDITWSATVSPDHAAILPLESLSKYYCHNSIKRRVDRNAEHITVSPDM